MTELTDTMAEDLLRLINIAVTEFGNTSGDMTIENFVDDVISSMNVTSAFAEGQYQEILDNLA